MKPPITDQQKHILQLLNTGWQIGYGSGPDSRVWLQQGGAGRGGKTEKVLRNDLDSLSLHRLVYVSKRSFPTSTVDITEAGTALLEDRWTDAIFEKVKAILEAKGTAAQVMPGDEAMAPTDHPSYGQISITHTTGGKDVLYGASLPHPHRISLSIHHSSISRDELGTESYREGKQIIELDLAADQLVSLLFNANRGSGVPCTIRSLNQKDVPPAPPNSRRMMLSRKFEKTIEAITDNANTLAAEADRILRTPGPLKADDKKYLNDIISKLVQDMRANVPFVETRFQEEIDQSIREAENQLAQQAQHLGLQAGSAPKLLQ